MAAGAGRDRQRQRGELWWGMDPEVGVKRQRLSDNYDWQSSIGLLRAGQGRAGQGGSGERERERDEGEGTGRVAGSVAGSRLWFCHF